LISCYQNKIGLALFHNDNFQEAEEYFIQAFAGGMLAAQFNRINLLRTLNNPGAILDAELLFLKKSGEKQYV
jgi:hypothetical protein